MVARGGVVPPEPGAGGGSCRDDQVEVAVPVVVGKGHAPAVEPPAPEVLLAFCRDRLSHFKCPRKLEIVDTVGRNTMGKVNKKKLRAPYWPSG